LRIRAISEQELRQQNHEVWFAEAGVNLKNKKTLTIRAPDPFDLRFGARKKLFLAHTLAPIVLI
jgi:hypothetical protein